MVQPFAFRSKKGSMKRRVSKANTLLYQNGDVIIAIKNLI